MDMHGLLELQAIFHGLFRGSCSHGRDSGNECDQSVEDGDVDGEDGDIAILICLHIFIDVFFLIF